LNENSAIAAKREAEKIRALGKYAAVLNVYMEEPPLVSDWRKLTETRNVVVVPFFISDGLHSYEDIPVLLGIAVRHPERSRGIPLQNAQVTSRDSSTSLRSARNDMASSGRDIFRRNPYTIDNRSLFYASSIGTDPGVADIIIEQANAAAKS
jgi:sirohydrochlorin cobaltochelatase